MVDDKDVINQKEYKNVSRFLKSAVTVHDQTQIETIFDFILYPKQTDISNYKKKHKYKVEAFFFFPKQMLVDRQHYDREKFLSDIRPLIRLQEPRFSYSEFKGEIVHDRRSPIISLKNFLHDYKEGEINIHQAEAIEYVKLFTCSFSRFMHKKTNLACNRLSQLSHLPETDKRFSKQLSQITEVFEKVWDLIREWRILSDSFYKVEQGSLEDLKMEFLLSNEFFSYRIRECLSRIKSMMLRLPFSNMQSEVLHRKMVAIIRLENWYANKYKFIWLKSDSPTGLREKFLVRYGSLKRRMWGVLYLMVRTRPFFSFQKQVGMMVAAGVAAAWALAANIFIFKSIAKVGVEQYTLENIGLSGLIVSMGFVFAYILKDRIKELSREQFKGGLFSQLPITNEKIQYKTANGKILNIGNIREFADIIDDPSNLPERIQMKRKRHEDYPGQRMEDGVVHYKKIIELDGAALASHEMPIYGVHDIMRFKIDRFTARLGNQMQNFWGINKDASVFSLQLPKVYHIDMILDYSRQNEDHDMKHISYDCRRLVLNKSGLIRVDQLE